MLNHYIVQLKLIPHCMLTNCNFNKKLEEKMKKKNTFFPSSPKHRNMKNLSLPSSPKSQKSVFLTNVTAQRVSDLHIRQRQTHQYGSRERALFREHRAARMPGSSGNQGKFQSSD